MSRRWPLPLICLATTLHVFAARGADSIAAGTVPFIFDDNRIVAELAFVRPDGALRKTLAFVDLGTPVPVITAQLARELQFDPHKPVMLRAGALPIPLDSAAVVTVQRLFQTGPNGRATLPVEAILSGSILKDYQVVFDYARQTLTLARPGTLMPSGSAVPSRVNEKTGLIAVDAVVAGRAYAIAVDPGSAYTWVRADVAERWVTAHPDWKRGTGAVGEANMQTRADSGEATAAILRVSEIGLGAVRLQQVGVLGITSQAPPLPPVPGESPVQGTIFDWYSRKAPEPVIGWLGGNVLKAFRLTIDFPRRMTYWERERADDAHDLDQVGITLETRDGQSGYFVAGLAGRNGAPTVDGVRVGDKLLQVDGVPLDGLTRGRIFSALHGPSGTVHVLLLERDGRRVTVHAKTVAF